MDHFWYRRGQLFCENVNVRDILESVGSPVFIYSKATLKDHFSHIRTAFSPLRPLICFSVKSLPNLAVLRVLQQLGSGMDVVSGGEYFRARRAGVSAANIVFAGVGKSALEIESAIQNGVHSINVESEDELVRLSTIASRLKTPINAAIRINPDVADPKTPGKTATGGRGAKFGVPAPKAVDLFTRFKADTYVSVNGIHIHIGSPISNAAAYINAIDVVDRIIQEAESNGCRIDSIDLGGGFPALYESGAQQETLDEIAEAICLRLEPFVQQGKRFIIEPGRAIAANAAILASTVEYWKEGWDKSNLVLDAGMNLLIRPSLYGSFHQILPMNVSEVDAHWSQIDVTTLVNPGARPVDIVGPICESGDFLGQQRHFPIMQSGDRVAIFSCGAYGMSMANQYNSRPRAAEVLVDDDRFEIIRRRETYDDLIAAEIGLPTFNER